ncbi:bifunctional hydroxymethylpyrimidine kinase/phosphomethylpyrimidine kinase [Bacillus infantis]|uniref:bifunctional hydroxymethylpyrimidine kinase/phosphomethylpyrimidine kinase n=1 Tax=Bacillus infantis TaxID=324767 RepID=UPI00344EEE84
MAIKKAMTIAGSDSGGGAGIQADLKTFQELGVYGMSALTAITAQNTTGVQAVFPMTAEAVSKQIESIGSDMGTDALKTGMLFDADIIKAVSDVISHYKWTKLVVDPVMIAKGGASLLQESAMAALKDHLLPLAHIITPNIPEAEAITGMKISTLADRKEAARKLYALGAGNVVIKGGHDAGNPEAAADLLFDGSTFEVFEGRRVDTVNTHGTGCTFSAAITAGLAKGLTVRDSVRLGKDFIQAAIEDDLLIGSGHGPTNHWAYKNRQKAEDLAYGAN